MPVNLIRRRRRCLQPILKFDKGALLRILWTEAVVCLWLQVTSRTDDPLNVPSHSSFLHLRGSITQLQAFRASAPDQTIAELRLLEEWCAGGARAARGEI